MKEPKAILFFLSIFAIFQFLNMILTPPITIQEGDFTTPFWIILWVLIGTALFLFLIRKKRIKVTQTWIIISYFFATFFAFNVFLDLVPSALLATAIILLRNVLKTKWMHNFGELIAYFGIIQIFVPLLSPITAVTLLTLLAIYDLLAVFVTKHMLKLVKTSAETGYVPAIVFSKTPSMLGGGDFIFPAVYISTMWGYGLHRIAAFSLIGILIGLAFLLLMGKKKKAYPALPPMAIVAFIATILAML